MKKYFKVLYAVSALSLFLSCVTLFSCKKDEESASDKTLALLNSGEWKMTNVTVDGVNKNDLFTGFTLTFAPNVYSSINGEPVWLASDTWSFTNSNKTAFTRGDGVIVNITSITTTNLTLTLQWDKTTLGGRSNSVGGEHIFEFSK